MSALILVDWLDNSKLFIKKINTYTGWNYDMIISRAGKPPAMHDVWQDFPVITIETKRDY